MQHSSNSSSPYPLIPGGMDLPLPRMNTTAFKRPRSHLAAKQAESQDVTRGLRPYLKSGDDPSHPNEGKNLPPPVNRVDKPRIPKKLAVVGSRTNLEPRSSAAENRISPFSTPPSSDESVSPENPKFEGLSQREVSGIGSRAVRESFAQPAPTPQASPEKQPSDDLVMPLRIRTSDARRNGFTQVKDVRSDLPEDRPGLPPRKVQDRAGSMQKFNEPNGVQAGLGDGVAADDSLTQNSTKHVRRPSNVVTPMLEYLPPPKRAPMSKNSNSSESQKASSALISNNPVGSSVQLEIKPLNEELQPANYASTSTDYPESTNINRRPPRCKKGILEIETHYDARLMEICGQHVCTTGHLTRAWNLISGELVLSLGHLEKDIRVTSLAFKPGSKANEEGNRLWLGTNSGDIQEVDIAAQSIVYVKTGSHDRREVVKIYRYQNSMWTLDDGGKLCIWSGVETGLPDLQRSPSFHRVPKGHTFSVVIQDTLWLATGKDIWVFHPNASESAAFSILQSPLTQPGIGVITSGAVIGGQLDRVYFGHADGKVTIYSIRDFSCLGIVGVSVYKISSLAGAGSYLWAGYNTGIIHIYDTRTKPWTTKKEWLAHGDPVLNILVDRGSLWKDGVLRVASLGADNALRLWDGLLQDDELGTSPTRRFLDAPNMLIAL